MKNIISLLLILLVLSGCEYIEENLNESSNNLLDTKLNLEEDPIQSYKYPLYKEELKRIAVLEDGLDSAIKQLENLRLAGTDSKEIISAERSINNLNNTELKELKDRINYESIPEDYAWCVGVQYYEYPNIVNVGQTDCNKYK